MNWDGVLIWNGVLNWDRVMNWDRVLNWDGVKVHKLLIKHEVKVAGYWPSSFLHVSIPRQSYELRQLWSKTESRSINSRKRMTSSHLCGFGEKFSWGTKWVVPRRQHITILPAQVAIRSTRIGLSCVHSSVNHIITTNLTSSVIAALVVWASFASLAVYSNSVKQKWTDICSNHG